MKKIISFLFLVFIVKLAAFSQQDPQFTNNMHYKLGVNPGFAGAEGTISGLILNRYQWAGLEGAPKLWFLVQKQQLMLLVLLEE